MACLARMDYGHEDDTKWRQFSADLLVNGYRLSIFRNITELKMNMGFRIAVRWADEENRHLRIRSPRLGLHCPKPYTVKIALLDYFIL
jgi:hypothetical protein